MLSPMACFVWVVAFWWSENWVRFAVWRLLGLGFVSQNGAGLVGSGVNAVAHGLLRLAWLLFLWVPRIGFVLQFAVCWYLGSFRKMASAGWTFVWRGCFLVGRRIGFVLQFGVCWGLGSFRR